MSTRHRQYDPDHWRRKEFGFWGYTDTRSGWGNASFGLLRAAREAGYSVFWGGRMGSSWFVGESEILEMRKKRIPKDIGMIWHEQPRTTWVDAPFGRNIAIVPFETTRVPSSWVKLINSFDALFVPCRQNFNAMRDSGIRIPIEIVHWGVDHRRFYPLRRPSDRPFTFGFMGALNERKGIDLLVNAFRKAFSPSVNVKLILKASFEICSLKRHIQRSLRRLFGREECHLVNNVDDERIEVHTKLMSSLELNEKFFKRIDCFVFPTRGEGFGFPPLEAMATGVPAIVTGWSGPVEYMTEEIGWRLRFSMTPADSFSNDVYGEDCGEWAEPNLEDLVSRLRYAFEHPNEVAQRGHAAAEFVSRNWLWKQKSSMFFASLNKFL